MKWEAIDIEWSRQCTDFLMSPVLDLMIDLLCGSYKIGNYCMPIGPIIKMINQKGKKIFLGCCTLFMLFTDNFHSVICICMVKLKFLDNLKKTWSKYVHLKSK